MIQFEYISKIVDKLLEQEKSFTNIDLIMSGRFCLDWRFNAIEDYQVMRSETVFGESQDVVVAIHKHYKGFLGTSNMLLAMRHGVPCKGTMSHQGPMAMQGVFGIVNANKKWRYYWRLTYGDKLNIFLPDTFTTEVFFRDFTAEEAAQWNLRQDSGDPHGWTALVIVNYNRLGEPLKNHMMAYSDNLNPEKFNTITNTYRELFDVAGGIGTNFSNDCGHPAVSIVIKLSQVNNGDGWVDVVKLSDDGGKHTGTPEAIAKAKLELDIL